MGTQYTRETKNKVFKSFQPKLMSKFQVINQNLQNSLK